jgi:hypothetical protein
MLAYLKAFVAYLKASVFSKYSGWHNLAEHQVHDRVVHGMRQRSVSALTWGTWAPQDASGTVNWRIAMP